LVICAAAVLAAAGCGFLEPKPLDERSEGRRPDIFGGESGTSSCEAIVGRPKSLLKTRPAMRPGGGRQGYIRVIARL
jgi:hypothetical protein